MLVTDVPDDLFGRGIAPPEQAYGFTIVLDTAEPWGGGRIAGRVEAREGRHDRHVVTVSVSCLAAWLDVAPELVGRRSMFRADAYWSMRTRFPVWLDEEAWLERWELGALATQNWLPFSIDLPPELPRAIEGTFVAFRYRVEARRDRAIGHDVASLPLLLREPRPIPVYRLETTPVGSWRLAEWRSEDDADAALGPCALRFEERDAGTQDANAGTPT